MLGAVRPKTLDHIAYWLDDRDRVANFATTFLGMHVIERTERFTLVGSDARKGKLTLFEADGPREPGALKHVALRVNDLEATLAELPHELDVARRDGQALFDVADGVRLGDALLDDLPDLGGADAVAVVRLVTQRQRHLPLHVDAGVVVIVVLLARDAVADEGDLAGKFPFT